MKIAITIIIIIAEMVLCAACTYHHPKDCDCDCCNLAPAELLQGED